MAGLGEEYGGIRGNGVLGMVVCGGGIDIMALCL